MEEAIKQNSFSSYSQEEGEKFKGEEKRILVKSMNYTLENGRDLGIPDRKDGKLLYPRIEFHLVDLRRDEIVLNCVPPLFELCVTTTMVALDTVIYVFGGLMPSIYRSDDFKRLQCLPTKSYQQIYMGASCIDLDLHKTQGQGWVPAPIPNQNIFNARCTSLFGKIYDFGSSCFTPEVLDPTFGLWTHLRNLPPEIVGCTVSIYALPDPSNHRILVHLSGGQLSSPSLYAYRPPDHPKSRDNAWECIQADFLSWTPVAAVFDDVIYFHNRKFPSLLRAFDLASRKWLKVHWSGCFESGVDMNNRTMRFRSLFPLGDNILCLSTWSRLSPFVDHPHGKTNLSFFKFRVQHCDATVNLIPLSSHSYDLPDTCEVRNFIPF